MSLQSFENSLVFNTLFFTKFTILIAIFNADCRSEGRVRLVRAWQCIMQWTDVAPEASSFTLFAKFDRAPIIAGAPSVQTKHRFSYFKPHFLKYSSTFCSISAARVVLCRGEQKKMASSMLVTKAHHTKTIRCETFETSVDLSN